MQLSTVLDDCVLVIAMKPGHVSCICGVAFIGQDTDRTYLVIEGCTDAKVCHNSRRLIEQEPLTSFDWLYLNVGSFNRQQ
jgi:hypothetical protein